MRLFTLLVLICCAAPMLAEERGPASKELARQCDELIARAVRRPYGWAWAENAPEAKPKGGAQQVTIQPPGTAAAGFVLYWAGDLLDEPRYKEAAYQAARGLAAAQRQTGLTPARPMFLPNLAGGREEATLVSDRAPTCASLGLLLSIIEDSGAKDPQIKGSALRALNWLLHQQTANGAWPQADPPATQPGDAIRFVRLDNGEWRNCTFILLLASEVLGDSRCTRAVERSNAFLLRMRVGDASSAGRPLWGTAYGLDAYASNRLADYPPGIDMLASRQAMQALIGTMLVLGDPPRQPVEEQPPTPSSALFDAAAAIEKLPKYDGQWIRIYDYEPAAAEPPPPLKPVGLEKIAPPQPPRYIRGQWGLDVALADIETLKNEGRGGLGKRLSERAALHQRLTAAVCGLDDEPFRLTDKVDEVRQGPEFEDKTSQRTRRLWRQLLQARLEGQH